MTRHNRSENAMREHGRHSYRSRMGRSTYTIDCPFCGTPTEAYVWSIAGGGKLCPNKKCGAKHTSFGVTYPQIGREDTQP